MDGSIFAERAIWKQRIYELEVEMTFDHRLERIGRAARLTAIRQRVERTRVRSIRLSSMQRVIAGWIRRCDRSGGAAVKQPNPPIRCIGLAMRSRKPPTRDQLFEFRQVYQRVGFFRFLGCKLGYEFPTRGFRFEGKTAHNLGFDLSVFGPYDIFQITLRLAYPSCRQTTCRNPLPRTLEAKGLEFINASVPLRPKRYPYSRIDD